MSKTQEIKITVNDVKFKVSFNKDKSYRITTYNYALDRKGKTLKVASYPVCMKDAIKMDVVKDLSEQFFYEVRHLLDKIKL